MVAKLDTLWLSGVVPDGNYSRSIYEWKRRLLRLAGGIRSIAGRAMIAARKKGGQVAEKALDGTGAEVEAQADTPEATVEAEATEATATTTA